MKPVVLKKEPSKKAAPKQAPAPVASFAPAPEPASFPTKMEVEPTKTFDRVAFMAQKKYKEITDQMDNEGRMKGKAFASKYLNDMPENHEKLPAVVFQTLVALAILEAKFPLRRDEWMLIQ